VKSRLQRNGIKILGALLVIPLALANPGQAATDRPPAHTLTVTTTEYRFTPNKLVFKRGGAYRLHLENHGKETHEFTAPEFFKAVEIGDPAPLDPDRVEIVIHPGEAKDLDFVAKTAGRYKLRCSDHDWAGMTGRIVVK
jgi:uncharacterized cupredoxin-like copper-binding protein